MSKQFFFITFLLFFFNNNYSSEPKKAINKRNDETDPFDIADIRNLVYNFLYDNNAPQNLANLSLVNKQFNAEITQCLTNKSPYLETVQYNKYDSLRFIDPDKLNEGYASLHGICIKKITLPYAANIIQQISYYDRQDIIPVILMGTSDTFGILFKYNEERTPKTPKTEAFAAITKKQFNTLLSIKNQYSKKDGFVIPVFKITFINSKKNIEKNFIILRVVIQDCSNGNLCGGLYPTKLNVKLILDHIEAPQKQDQQTNNSKEEYKSLEITTKEILIKRTLECIMALSAFSFMFSIFMLLYINF